MLDMGTRAHHLCMLKCISLLPILQMARSVPQTAIRALDVQAAHVDCFFGLPCRDKLHGLINSAALYQLQQYSGGASDKVGA